MQETPTELISNSKAIRQEESVVQMKSEGSQLENSPLLREGSSFCSVQIFD